MTIVPSDLGNLAREPTPIRITRPKWKYDRYIKGNFRSAPEVSAGAILFYATEGDLKRTVIDGGGRFRVFSRAKMG
jgi:hypothetical protein